MTDLERPVARAGAALKAARMHEAEAFERLRVAVIAACLSGMPEATAARLGGVDRMTVRKWMGKR